MAQEAKVEKNEQLEAANVTVRHIDMAIEYIKTAKE